MKKKNKKSGFSMLEIGVAMAIFLVVMIPLLQMTRNVNTAGNSFKKFWSGAGSTLAGTVPSAGTGDARLVATSEDGINDMLGQLVKQAERAGYTKFADKLTKAEPTVTSTYTLSRELTTANGCSIGQYTLSPLDEITKDPSDTGEPMCFTSVFNINLDGAQVKLTMSLLSVGNFAKLSSSENSYLNNVTEAPAILVNALFESSGDYQETILTPLQDPCVIE